jgi:hypothetical protein
LTASSGACAVQTSAAYISAIDDEPEAGNDNLNLAEWRAIRGRVEMVAKVLDLPRAEVLGAMSWDGLLAFSSRHHQSLDWLVEGDPRVMIARCAAA